MSAKSLFQTQIPLKAWLTTLWRWLNLEVKWPLVADRTILSPIKVFPLLWLILATRIVGLLAHPQFYAEDGTVFFAEAWNEGFASLWIPYSGYLHLIPRMVAFLSTFDPLRAELWAILAASAAQAGVAAFVFSRRVRLFFPWRCLLAFLILGYPNMQGLVANTANIQWFAIVWVVFVLLSEPNRSRAGRLLEGGALCAVALSTPMSLFLLPIALYRLYKAKGLRIDLVLWLLGTAIQAYVLFQAGGERHFEPTHAKLALLASMIKGSLVSGAVFGVSGVGGWSVFLDLSTALFCVLILVVYLRGFRFADRYARALMVLGTLVLIAALLGIDWRALNMAGQGQRYFFILGMMFVPALIFNVAKTVPLYTVLALGWGGFVYLLGIQEHWAIRHVEAQTFRDVAHLEGPKSFDIAPTGWSVQLKR